MNTKMKLAACVLAIAPFTAFADDETTTSTSCMNKIVFSQEFLTKYPNAGKACREVVTKDRKKYARFDANVVNVKGNEVTADFMDSYNNKVSTVTFSTKPEARVQMEGTEVKVSELKAGDKLSFWVPESRAGFYAAPGAAESRKLAVVSTKAAER
jgi:hypothetical protein